MREIAPSFFRASNRKILLLINSAPKTHNRCYSSVPTLPLRDEGKPKRDAFLRKYGLHDLNLVWPQTVNSSQTEVDYVKKNPKSISQMYGESDLSKLPIFQGGFINFGYWPNPFFNDSKISIEQRIECSKELYRVIGNLAGILKHYSSILEVGCGLGYGTALLSQQFQPKLAIGLDISPDQVARAKKCHVSGIKSGKLRFTIGEAESLPFADHSFDSVISVEAAQHFISMSSFSEEVSRILKPGGKLVMTSFFPANKEGVEALNAIIPDYHVHGSQHTIDEIQGKLATNMEGVKVKSIGENVWDGFAKWLDQIGYQHQWTKIWGALYEKGLIDYVIYEAEAPKESLQLKSGF
ncbi:MAG: class I SAM-dependent methyltransferase [Gammaproteobacteria bacterium]